MKNKDVNGGRKVIDASKEGERERDNTTRFGQFKLSANSTHTEDFYIVSPGETVLKFDYFPIQFLLSSFLIRLFNLFRNHFSPEQTIRIWTKQIQMKYEKGNSNGNCTAFTVFDCGI